MEVTEIRKLAAVESRHWWYRERRLLLRQLVADVAPAGASGLVALDVGAAGGGNTVVLDSLGMLAVPVEYEREGASIAHGRGLPVLQADAAHLPIGAETVDVVVAFDVLEHIEDHQRVIAEMHRVLRPGGWLLVAVPADMGLWSAHDAAVGHVRRYSREDLSELVSGAGLSVREIWSWNVLMRPLVSFRRRGLKGSHLDEPGRMSNTALSGIIGLERRVGWLRHRKGVSLMLKAQK